jgi:hypothetical protein
MIMERALKNDYDTKIVNLVHDSILLETPADASIIRNIYYFADQVMTSIPRERFGCEVPFAIDIEIGKNWGEQVAFSLKHDEVSWEKDGQEIHMPFRVWYNTVMEGYK